MSAEDVQTTDRRRTVRVLAARVATVLGCLLVLLVLVTPSGVSRLTPAAFVRIPVEGLLVAAAVLVLPVTARRVVAVSAGVAVGVLAIVKILDRGFVAVLDRPFDPVLDWSFLDSAVVFVGQSAGRAGAVGYVVAAVLLAIGLLALVTLSVLRMSRLVVEHRTAAARVVTAVGAIWVICALLGAQIVPGVPVAADDYYDRLVQVNASLKDRSEFAAAAAHDAFREARGEDLLTALRGKDIIVAFVESYGRVAVQDPELGPQLDAQLDAGDDKLRAAGFDSRSAFLTSPTAGGGSWLAHATLLSGVWVDNRQRYDALPATDRLTIGGAFRRAGWRTVAVMPGNNTDWPQAEYFGYDRVYDARDLQYRGANFSFATMPDQYALSAFQRLERARPESDALMAEVSLVSSHAPWSPVPPLVDWDDVGDGSVFDTSDGAGDPAEIVWQRDPKQVRADYVSSIGYSLTTLISYVEAYGDDDLVLVILGDHQPAPVITGEDANRDVPITIVARDPAVFDRISGWGWQSGLSPDPHAPVWPMDAFRDRLLSAYGA
jgi:hypothetical protein